MKKKKYIATGHYIDARLEFDTMEEAQKNIREWVESDKEEFGYGNPTDYYVVIEER